MKTAVRTGMSLVLWVVCTAPLHAEEIEILALHPGSETAMAPREALYAHVHYDAAQPVRIQARGLLAGRERAGMTNASPLYSAGMGEALAWIAYEGGRIDALNVRVHDRHWKLIGEVTLPVSVEWRADAPRTQHSMPAWLDAARKRQQQLLEVEARRHGEAAGGSGAIYLLIRLAGLSVPGYFVLQIVALRKLKNGWRRLAWLPLWIMAAVFAVTVLALLRASNLWPIWLLLVSPLVCVYLGGLLLAWRYVRGVHTAA